MFESTQLDRIGKLEIEKLELKASILKVNPRNVISGYIQAKRKFRAAQKIGKVTKQIQAEYIEEAKKLGNYLQIDDINDIITKPNTSVLEMVEGVTDFKLLEELKSEFKRVKIRLDKETEKLKSEKPGTSTKNRLFTDSKNVLEYYANKMPQIQVLDEQIKILESEKSNYLAHNLKDEAKKCQTAISELVEKKKNVKNTFSNINKTKSRAVIAEQTKLVNQDPRYVELKNTKRELKSKLIQNSPSKIVEKLKLVKSNYDTTIIDFDNPSEFEVEYNEHIAKIANLLGIENSEVRSMSNSKIRIALKELDLTTSLNNQLDNINVEMTMIKSKILDSYSTEDMLYDIFDYSNDDTEGKIPKDILIAANIKKAEGYVNSLCYKLDQQRNYDDALSGGLVGLVTAVNTWYEKQKPLDSGLRFSDFFGRYVYSAAQRALYEISASGSASGSTFGTLEYKQKLLRENLEKRVKLYIEQNPNMAQLKSELLQELMMQDELENGAKKVIKAVSETDYNAVIGGGDGPADMWGTSTYQKESFSNDEILDGKQKYNSLLKSISQLMDLFDVREKSGVYVVNENRKLMDIYDRQIFLMRTGLDYKKTQAEVESNKMRDVYTLREIADEISEMKKSQGSPDAKMSEVAVLARWKRMISKLKAAIEMKPEIKAGLEYMLSYIDDNRDLMKKMSNDREAVVTKNERQKLRDSYKDNEDVLNIEMLDGKRLGDDYHLSDDNSLEDINVNL